MEKNFLNIEEVKKIELNILEEIDKFCKKNKIEYFINYGTLLGAIRHKGYIPWDDDIDLMMSSENYEKFIKLFNHNKYKIFTHENHKGYFNNFLKVVDTTTRIIDNRNYKTYESGVSVDIFPYYKFNNKKVVEKTYFWESIKLLSFSKRKNIVYGDNKIKDIIRTFFWIILHPISPQKIAHKQDKIIKKFINNNGNYCGVLASKLKYTDIFEKGIFDELIELNFEHLKLPAPKNYDKILTQFYGNYMELPPIEKQVYPHETDVYKI